MKKTTRSTAKTTHATAPARKKLALKKDAVKDLSAAPTGKAAAVKGGTYTTGSRR